MLSASFGPGLGLPADASGPSGIPAAVRDPVRRFPQLEGGFSDDGQSMTPSSRSTSSPSPAKVMEEAEAVRDAFIAALKQRAFDELGPLDVQLMGWRGIEGRDVMVEVRHQGASSLYELVTPDMAPRIIQSHLDEHRPVRRWVVGKDFEAYYEPQKMHISELLGKIDPQCLEEYQDYDGYKSPPVVLQPGL